MLEHIDDNLIEKQPAALERLWRGLRASRDITVRQMSEPSPSEASARSTLSLIPDVPIDDTLQRYGVPEIPDGLPVMAVHVAHKTYLVTDRYIRTCHGVETSHPGLSVLLLHAQRRGNDMTTRRLGSVGYGESLITTDAAASPLKEKRLNLGNFIITACTSSLTDSVGSIENNSTNYPVYIAACNDAYSFVTLSGMPTPNVQK